MLEMATFLLLVAAFFTAVCALYGRILTPDSAEETWAVIRGDGPGNGLEQQVRSLMWLRSWGLLRCRVILDDGGLDPDGRELARTLTRRWPELELLSEQTL
ncbi:MAG: hypothetical protein E7450_00450 [Ruminococcaceae bacterium]|nr:hypothetical protein [Oscillospiraceae bacterium]